jgi:hypothetical protein
MPRLTLRRKVWGAVAVLAAVVLGGSAYLLTARRPPDPGPVIPASRHDMAGEERRAKQLPEYAELRRLGAKENRPPTPEAVARFAELAGHPNWWIRNMAVGLIGHAPPPLREAATATAASRLADPNIFVRSAAMDALGSLGARDRIPDLVALLGSADPDDRACARRTLRQLGHPVE